MSQLGNFLRQARRKVNLSQQALADGFKISKAAVSKWESGVTVPDRRKMQQLAHTLGVPVDELRNMADQDDGTKQGDLPAALVTRPPRTPEAPPQSPSGTAPPLRVYGSAESGPDGAFVLSSDPVAWIARDARLVGVVDAFAVYVQGTSMNHAYEPGNLLLVNPGAQPISGDDVLLVREERDGTMRALVRRLVRYNSTTWTVKQFNPEKTYGLPRSRWQRAHLVIGKYNRG